MAKIIAGTMTNQASKYIRLSGNLRISIFSPKTVISKSKIIVNRREVIPTGRSWIADRDKCNSASTTLVVMKNDTKLQIGTVAIARAEGSLLTMASGCL